MSQELEIISIGVQIVMPIAIEAFNRIDKKWRWPFLNQERKKIKQATIKYVETYTKRHCLLKVLGTEEVSLNEIYTDIIFLKPNNINVSLEERLKSSREEIKIEIIEKEKRLMVLGEPGSGKSTFLRKTGFEALQRHDKKLKKQKYIPVFLELKRFRPEEKVDIENLIVCEFQNSGFVEPFEFTQEFLRNGDLLILFDGLDEVQDELSNEVVTAIKNFVDRYNNNCFVVSCRRAAYKSYASIFTGFKEVEIGEFNDKQIETFIKKWFMSIRDTKAEETSKRFWKLLQKEENKGAKDLAKTPLLLTFLCSVYNNSQKLITDRASLYERALSIYLERWINEKRLHVEEKAFYKVFESYQEEVLLAEIAYNYFTTNSSLFDKKSLIKYIKNFFANDIHVIENANISKVNYAEKILDDINISQGIIVERVDRRYSFSHLTLQEYLTARYIVDNEETNLLIQNYLFEKRWREIFLLVAGLIKGPNPAKKFLKAIQSEIDKLFEKSLYQNKFIPILKWSEQETSDYQQNTINSKDKLSLVAKRALANFYAISYAFARAYDNDDTPYTDAYTNAAILTSSERNFNINDPNSSIYAFTYAQANVREYTKAYLKNFYSSNSEEKQVNTDVDSEIYSYKDSYQGIYTRAYTYARRNAYIYMHIYVFDLFIKSLKKLSTMSPVFTSLDIANLIKDLQCFRTQIPNSGSPKSEHQEFARQIMKVVSSSFKIQKWICLNKKELQEIEKYYYGIYLLIQCKQAMMARVSPDTWATIEEQMFRIPDRFN